MLPPLPIFDSDAFEGAIHAFLDMHPSFFNISTFCIPTLRAVARFIPYTERTKFRILTGLPPGIKKEEAQGYDELKRMYPGMQFRFATSHHAKLYVAELALADGVIVGSKNIGMSGWREVGVTFRDPNNTYRKLFLSWWNGAFTNANKCRLYREEST